MKTAYWFGYGGSTKVLEPLMSIIQETGFKLVTIHEWDSADIKWNRATWLNELKKADIIVLPANYKIQPAKSNTRLSQALSLGKPVICSPLDSYLRIYKEFPDCCLIADTLDDWKTCLEKLRDDEELCKKLSEQALRAAQKYSLEEIGKKWISVFNSLDKTDIIIPTYDNLICLKQCIESIRVCTTSLYNIIVVNNGLNKEVDDYLKTQNDVFYFKENRMNFAQAINVGLRNSTSRYICLLNDDVIVSDNWLEKMLETCKDNIGVVGPLSNCDFSWLHHYNIIINDVELKPGIHSPGFMEPDYIHKYKSPYDEVIEREWIAFYCTLIQREVVNTIGFLDEISFSNSGEDVDYCSRVRKAGYKIFQNYNSFVFHYGGVSRRIIEKENFNSYHELDKMNRVHLVEKLNKKTVVLYSGPGWEKWDYKNIDQGGIGGSETWQVHMSKEFSNLGFRVLNFNDCLCETTDGLVRYIPYTKLPEYIEYNWFDYFVCSRTTEPFRLPIRASKNIVMIHDIWISKQNTVQYHEKVDKFCVLSEWHKNFVAQHHGLDKERLFIVSNGINLDRYKTKVERNPYRLHWSSSLDRGLDTLLYLFDFIKLNVPQVELHIYYGTDNWEKLAVHKPQEQQKIESIKKAMDKPGVFYHGRVGQEQLAKEQLRSALWAYPTDFEETFSITAIECQAAGVPIVASNYAGLRTTVNNTGLLIGSGLKGESYTRDFRLEFTRKCIKLLKDKNFWEEWSQKGLENAQKYSWANVAKQWVKEIFI